MYAWVYTDIGIILYVFCDYTESLVFSLERKAGNVVHTLNTLMDQSISKTVSSITVHGLRYCSHRIIYIVFCFQGYFLNRVLVTKDFQVKKNNNWDIYKTLTLIYNMWTPLSHFQRKIKNKGKQNIIGTVLNKEHTVFFMWLHGQQCWTSCHSTGSHRNIPWERSNFFTTSCNADSHDTL